MAFTFRPSKNGTKKMEQIKSENDLKTNSKALEYVLKNFQFIENESRNTKKQLSEIDNELRSIKEIIVNKFESDRSYNEMICNLIPKESGYG